MSGFALLLLSTCFKTTMLPSHVDLRGGYEAHGLSVCQQTGPLCWDYTVVGLLEYEFATHRERPTRLSPGFLAWAANATDIENGAGSNFGRAYRGLEKYGIAPLSLGGDPDSKGLGPVPDEKTLQVAASEGRVDVHWVRFWNDKDELSEAQLAAILTEISEGHPVAVGMRWPNKTRFTSRSSFMLQVPDRGDVFDGHCVALVGYQIDSSLPGGGAFLFRNSWGANWADHGYAWMPFALLKFCINDALTVRLWPPLKAGGFEAISFPAASLAIDDCSGPTPQAQDMAGFGPQWGRGRQLFFQADQVGQSFGLDVNVETAGKYAVRLVITRAQDYGLFVVSVNGAPAPTVPVVIDGAGPGVSRSNPLPAGNFDFNSGKNRLVFTVTGRGPASTGLYVGVDSVELVPLH